MEKKLMDYSNKDADLQMRQDLNFADFSGADLSERNLEGAILFEANLRNANLVRVNLTGADLRGANLCGASLVGAKLDKADLRGAIFIGADLTGATIQGAQILGSNMRGAFLCDSLYQITCCGSANVCLTYDAINDVVNCNFWKDGNGNKLESFRKFIKNEYSIGGNNPDVVIHFEYLTAYEFFRDVKRRWYQMEVLS